MTDAVTLKANVGSGTDTVATELIGGKHYALTKLYLGAAGVDGGPVTTSNPVPVAIQGALGSVTVSNFPATQPVSGTVSVSGTVPVSGTFWQATQPVSLASLPALATGSNVIGAVTQSGSWSVGVTGSVAVTGPLTDGQLRASAIPVSAASLPLPTNAATEATLAAINDTFKAEDTPAVSGDRGLPLLAMRQIADTTSTDADGDYTLIKIDEEGRVKVATKPASFTLVTGNITANSQTVFCDVSRASNVMISMVATSLVGHNSTFEGSIDSTNGTDGNWFGIQVIRSNANTIELTTGVLAATPAYAWEASVNGLSFIRVRATAHTSGTANWKFQRGSYATEPIPAAQISGTQPVSGTVTATVGTSISGGTISPLTVAGVTVEASAARTTTANGTTITNASARGAHFIFNISASSGTTPTLVFQLQVQDSVSSNWVDVPGAATASITGVSTVMLTVCPGIVEAANSRVNNGLPRTFRFRWTIGGATPSFTFSISAQYII